MKIRSRLFLGFLFNLLTHFITSDTDSGFLRKTPLLINKKKCVLGISTGNVS